MSGSTSTAPPALPRSALVTGAAKRIGRAVALSLAADGWSVAIHYRSSSRDATALAVEIAKTGGRACAIGADLSRETEARELVPRTVELLGPLGLLINNAAHFERDDVRTASRDTWDRHLETNLRAPLVLMQAFAAQRPEGAPALVINLLDQWVWNPPPDFISYTVSKSALWTLTQTMALALAPEIRVNAIGPGPTLRSRRQSPEHFAALAARSPLGRPTTPAEICDAVRYLVATPSVTGQMIALDGGQHLA